MKRKQISYVLLVMLLMSVLTTGCTEENEAGAVKPGADSSKTVSVLDIKKKYGMDTEKSIMPLYNVERDKEFNFNYNFIFGDTSLSDIVSVHTDIKCLPDSRIPVSVWSNDDIKEEKSQVSVKPLGYGVLSSESDESSSKSTWGNAPIYYIRLNYDMDAKELAKLEKPMIIPFTVKSEAPVPNLRYEIDSYNRLKLAWDPVEGAEKYNIYQAQKITLLDTTNLPLSGPEQGYKGVMPQLLSATNHTEFNDFLMIGNGGLNSLDDGQIVTGQNCGVGGEYYITAVVEGKESSFSRPVNTVNLSKHLPLNLKTDIAFTSINSINDLPGTVPVEYIDGSIQNNQVVYETEGLDSSDTQLWFRVRGTAFRAYVSINLTDKDIAALKSRNNNDAVSGYVEPENSTDMVPKPDVPTIINGDDSSSSGENVVDAQRENTEKQVEQGNKEAVNAPEAAGDMELVADSALEEYLALQLLNGKEEISLKAFPESQNFDTFSDVFKKVLYQNPLILGIKEFKYCYDTLNLVVKYNDPVDKMKKQQEEIILEANKIVDSVIKSSMTDGEKRKALYDYLNDNTQYDTEALKSAEENDFLSVDEKFNDSFTTYGIMVKKVGVCMSYAYTYKMLCQKAGVDCIIVTGAIGGVPHAWNKVKIDNEWVHVDSTNNSTNSGIPYMLYNANDKTSIENTYAADNEYWTDGELDKFVGNSDKYDYYVVNNLEVASLEEYKSVITDKLKDEERPIVLRLASKIEQDQLVSTTAEVFSEVAGDKMDTARMGELGRYVILTY